MLFNKINCQGFVKYLKKLPEKKENLERVDIVLNLLFTLFKNFIQNQHEYPYEYLLLVLLH